MITSDGCARGRSWKRTPSQPCPPDEREEPCVATVSAKRKSRLLASCRIQLSDQLAVLVVQHRLQPRAADKMRRGPVERVADVLVVCRNRFGDGGRGLADVKKPAGHLLPGADLREGAVPGRIQIDLESLFLGAVRILDHRRFHSYHPTPRRQACPMSGAMPSSGPRARLVSPERNQPGTPRPKGTAPPR